MSAAELSEKSFLMLTASFRVLQATKVTQSDWIVLDNSKGVIPLIGITGSTSANAAETFTYGVATIGTSGATASTTSLSVTSATITRKGPFYALTASGEIIEVTADSAPSNATATWTVKRGCFGTTASATGIANGNVVHILNIIFLGSSTVGGELFAVLCLPEDAGAKLA